MTDEPARDSDGVRASDLSPRGLEALRKVMNAKAPGLNIGHLAPKAIGVPLPDVLAGWDETAQQLEESARIREQEKAEALAREEEMLELQRKSATDSGEALTIANRSMWIAAASLVVAIVAIIVGVLLAVI